ncbi:cathepsin L-like proteinase [Protopterus annectens]|uniref:cathepsin L-like proteinase n=1 Tax=Protopterus annectens TaxID=7888 RepID=UPI001CFB6B9C|nr:cathepsin L-like proteinase [Protopterus annectens]
MVMNHNMLADEGKKSYRLEMNQFADMTSAEMVQNTPLMSWDVQGLPVKVSKEENMSIPKEVDWRTKNCVTEVKQQGNCHSCWAFSTVGAVESRYCVKHHYRYSFSVQQLVDCDEKNCGCRPGYPDYAYQYIEANGLMKENDYPYKAEEGKCLYNKSHAIPINISCIAHVNRQDIAGDVSKYGPTSAAISLGNDIHLYKNGVYENRNCNKEKVSHAIIIDGYGPDYWIVRNSWGKQWGIRGYMLLKRNLCHIEDHVLSVYLK